MGWKTSSYFPPLEDDKAKGESKTLVGATEGESRASIPSSLLSPLPIFPALPISSCSFRVRLGTRGGGGEGAFPLYLCFFSELEAVQRVGRSWWRTFKASRKEEDEKFPVPLFSQWEVERTGVGEEEDFFDTKQRREMSEREQNRTISRSSP